MRDDLDLPSRDVVPTDTPYMTKDCAIAIAGLIAVAGAAGGECAATAGAGCLFGIVGISAAVAAAQQVCG